MASSQEDQFAKIRAIAMASAAKLTAEKMPAALTLRDPSFVPPPPAKRPRTVEDCETGPDSILSSIQAPVDVCGYIIGKKGENVKKMEAHYGVVIQITPEQLAPGIKTITLMGGTEEAQAQVTEHILGVIEKEQERMKQVDIVETFEVPERYVGFIVGKKGENMKAVLELSGCRVDVGKELTPDGGKVISITSRRPEGIEQARRAIEFKLLEAYRRAGIFNAPLESKFAPEMPPPPPQHAPPCIHQDVALSAVFATAAKDVALTDVLAAAKEAGEAVGIAGPPNQLGLTGSGSKDLEGVLPMEVDASAAHADAYSEAISQWAAFYAREPTCVEYYMNLRSQAAQAFCSESTTEGVDGGA